MIGAGFFLEEMPPG